jgi:undecaprenyl-diphosphatase
MNFFDFTIIKFVNQFSQHSFIFDKIVKVISENDLFKGGVLITIIWWGWFKIDKRQSENRLHIISALISCCFAIALARALQIMLPFRNRPLSEEALHFLPPYEMSSYELTSWSSFPSDHAVLFFSLAMSTFFVSKSACKYAFSYTLLFIALPRIYLGLHYPSDVVAGAIVGIILALLGNIYLPKSKYIQLINNLSHSKPHYFYVFFFLLNYQIVELFNSSRNLVSQGYKLIKTLTF